MKLAVVGAGISGLCAARFLQDSHDITLFESMDWLGGHTHTVAVPGDGDDVAIDTGFIVCNDRTYPAFLSILSALNVPIEPTDMSFSVRCGTSGFEYGAGNLGAVFAQSRNMVSGSFLSLMTEIVRFNRHVKQALDQDGLDAGQSLGDFYLKYQYSERLKNYYLVPICAAIWSADSSKVLDIPFQFFASFFRNHGLLDLTNRPQWYVVSGGSANYVHALVNALSVDIRRSTPVASVERLGDGVDIVTQRFGRENFDGVVIATHSDQALAMLQSPTPNEEKILSAITYQKNRVVLHHDESFMPQARRAWSSWNYVVNQQSGLLSCEDQTRATVTYHMNRLQNLTTRRQYFVTLNPSSDMDGNLQLGEWEYSHPVFDSGAIAMRERVHTLGDIAQGVWFCGAYSGNGFHEDGVISAMQVAQNLSNQCGHAWSDALFSAMVAVDKAQLVDEPGKGALPGAFNAQFDGR